MNRIKFKFKYKLLILLCFYIKLFLMSKNILYFFNLITGFLICAYFLKKNMRICFVYYDIKIIRTFERDNFMLKNQIIIYTLNC